MKTGMSLTDLAKEIERRKEAKKDFIAPIGKMKMVINPGKQATLALASHSPGMHINNVAHGQISEFTKIPMDYYRRMLDTQPGLLADNVNTWFSAKAEGDRRMVRTLDNNVRAILSDKYRALENEDLAEVILPALLDKNLMILSADITETRMYIKAVDKKILLDIPTGCTLGAGHARFDTISPGIIISNSEVGFGALSIETGIYTGGCTNLMIAFKAMRKYHTGVRAEISEEVYTAMTNQTKQLTDAALWSQVRDVVTHAMSKEGFDLTAAKLVAATADPMGDQVIEVVKAVGRKFTVSEGEQQGILARLIEGGDLTRYGLHSAITRHSADVLDYDRATVLERLGGQIIELPKNDWQAILKQAA